MNSGTSGTGLRSRFQVHLLTALVMTFLFGAFMWLNLHATARIRVLDVTVGIGHKVPGVFVHECGFPFVIYRFVDLYLRAQEIDLDKPLSSDFREISAVEYRRLYNDEFPDPSSTRERWIWSGIAFNFLLGAAAVVAAGVLFEKVWYRSRLERA